MRKKIKHVNFDTRDSYGEHNSSVLSKEFLSGGFDVPLWGTENQFANNGMKVQKGALPVYLLFKTEEESHFGHKMQGVKNYPVFNFSQTESNKEIYWSEK